ncbi:hypothetical protein H0O02_00065 [Candidatus Micrarchaeota archaeon]|nr:hypothetical protein [Candidatus Micrarchaeota archaeon]
MTYKIVALLLMALSCLAYSQSASEYCSSERIQGESCYQDCCESLGYSWGNGGCLIEEAEQGQVSAACDYCTDAYVACVESYESGLTGGSTTGGGCCVGSVLLFLGVVSIVYPRR